MLHTDWQSRSIEGPCINLTARGRLSESDNRVQGAPHLAVFIDSFDGLEMNALRETELFLEYTRVTITDPVTGFEVLLEQQRLGSIMGIIGPRPALSPLKRSSGPGTATTVSLIRLRISSSSLTWAYVYAPQSRGSSSFGSYGTSL